MKYAPCEYIVWNVLPVIRKAIAECMIENYGLNQREIAEKLSVTPPAVSQYLSGKRGNLNISDNEICKEINISAERIIKNGNEILVYEICRLCKFFRPKNLFSLDKKEKNYEILNNM
jgi:predicted transcriptional regulator